MSKGMIVKTSRDIYDVLDLEDGNVVRCSVRGRMRLGDTVPLAGDLVNYATSHSGSDTAKNKSEKETPVSEKRGVILEILPRKNSLTRPPMANADKLIIVVSMVPPVTPLELIDTLTALAEHNGIEPVICLNKIDLYEDMSLLEIYKRVGYDTCAVSAQTGEGIEDLLSIARGHLSVLTGNSGVGKSSILNKLLPGSDAKTGALSERIGRGRQTTRYVELFPLEGGGYVADTPGYAAFDAVTMELTDAEQLPFYFPEFDRYIGKCRFNNCGHHKDEGCAITEALSRGEITPSRYESFIRIKTAIDAMEPDYSRR